MECFWKLPEVKKLIVSGNFKYVTKYDDEHNLTEGTKLNTVTFNTKLKLENVEYFNTKNLVVKRNDSHYKSIKGVIYSKDGKSLVRVPFLRKKLVVANGCEKIYTNAVSYISGGYENGCDKLKKIAIPSSVKAIKNDKYLSAKVSTRLDNIDITVKTKQLDGKSLVRLLNDWNLDVEKLRKQLPEQITKTGGMYITSDGILLEYWGNEITVKVPDGIKEIGEEAFSQISDVKRVELSDSVTVIGEKAFYRAKDLTSINMTENLKIIGSGAFEYTAMDEVKLPAGLEEIGESFCMDQIKRNSNTGFCKKDRCIRFYSLFVAGENNNK